MPRRATGPGLFPDSDDPQYDEPYAASPRALPAFQRHSRTSRDAAIAALSLVNSLRGEVLRRIAAAPDGLTDEQLIDALQRSPSSVRPRRIELVNDFKLVRDSGRVRKTRAGYEATVWEIDEARLTNTPDTPARMVPADTSGAKGS